MVSNPGYQGPNLPGPVANYCNGTGFNSAVVPGRLGSFFNPNTPYVNPFGSPGASCNSGSSRCAVTNVSTNGVPDGYKDCPFTNPADHLTHWWQNVITVYRAPNYTPVFDTGYFYQFLPKTGTIGMAMDLTGGWTSNGTLMNQYNYDDEKDNQKFTLVPAGNGNYFIKMKTNTNKCFDVSPASYANNAPVEIWDCNGGSNQQWNISTSPTNDGSLHIMNVAAGRCLDNQNVTTASAALILWDCHTGAYDQGYPGQNWAVAATQ